MRVRPYGIETARQYRFIRPPSLMMWGHSHAIRFDSECSALAGQQIDWFWVGSGIPFDAVEAWLAFLAAADAVRDHKLKPGKCELEAEGSTEDCADHLGTLLDFGHVTGVVKDLVDGRKRYQLFVSGFYITIGTRRPNTDLLVTPKAEDIVSIDIEPKGFVVD
jgi:hypothetical protein